MNVFPLPNPPQNHLQECSGKVPGQNHPRPTHTESGTGTQTDYTPTIALVTALHPINYMTPGK